MSIIVKVTQEAKEYYLEHKDDPSCDFSRFCRDTEKKISIKEDTIFIRYYLKDPESRFEAFKRRLCCFRKKENLSEKMITGRVLIALYQLEEPFQMKNKFVQCVEKIIQLKLGKGIEKIKKQGFRGCFIKRNYWPEKLDPQHYSIILTEKLFDRWEKSATTLRYQEWRKSDACYRIIERFQRNPENVEMEFRTIGTDKITGKLCARVDLAKIKVEYLDEKKRQKYLVYFKTCLMKKTKLFDGTKNPFTGTLIYVIDANRNIFAAPKQEGSFHHSSLLGGEAVICAGRIALNNRGEILWISNESGHYAPTEDDLKDGLKVFAEKGVDINDGCVVNMQAPSNPSTFFCWTKNKKSPAFQNLEELK